VDQDVKEVFPVLTAGRGNGPNELNGKDSSPSNRENEANNADPIMVRNFSPIAEHQKHCI